MMGFGIFIGGDNKPFDWAARNKKYLLSMTQSWWLTSNDLFLLGIPYIYMPKRIIMSRYY